MTRISNVTLAFSCTEQQEVFTKTTKGLFCSTCSNHVLDFTNKSLHELQKEINNSPVPVCGIFKRRQLHEHFIRYAAATCIATSSFTLPAWGQTQGKESVPPQADEHRALENQEEIFLGLVLETYPEPLGGYKKFIKALKEEIRYPKELVTKGKTFVEFTIDTTGQMDDIRIVKGFDEMADQEAVRALKALNYPFIPARQRSKPVRSRLVIPVTFDRE